MGRPCVTWAGSYTDEAIHSISDELKFRPTEPNAPG